jgi:peptidoglycan/LPS O-acetylase OafA/YrhL
MSFKKQRLARRLDLTMGAVAVAAGASGLARGAAEVFGSRDASTNVDSEYRFYAAWYLVAGVLALTRPPEDRRGQAAFAAGFGTAALGRILSIRSRGWPHPFQRFLLAVEVVLPLAYLAALRGSPSAVSRKQFKAFPRVIVHH